MISAVLHVAKEARYVLSAVLYISSVRKLCCDCTCGHKLAYKRKVAIVYYDVIRSAVIVKFLT